MKKQTAVEWLYDNLNKCFDKFDNGEYAYTDFVNASKEVRDQAKAMEKEQIIKAAIVSHFEGVRQSAKTSKEYLEYGEQYYNETYGK